MKVRTLAVTVALALAAWLPTLAQQSAPASQAPVNPPAAAQAAPDASQSCSTCCQSHKHGGKKVAAHRAADCCAGKDAKAMDCCQSKDGKQAACCQKDSMPAMDCCKGHDASTSAAQTGKEACATCNGKDGKSCCGKDAVACNMKDKKDCCAGMSDQCPAHSAGR